MSRQSSRKVKLTSKFEEFSTSRLANIQRSNGQTTPQPQEPQAPQAVTPVPQVAQVAHVPQVLQTPKTPQTPRTPQVQATPMPKLTANGKIRGRPRKIWQQKAETVVKPMSSAREELLRLREENVTLKSQLEQLKNDFEELKRQSSYTGQTVPKMDYDDLKEKYQKDLMHAKRREWCVVCLNPSRYYCCWNTTYCSQKCQVHDWYQRHLKLCVRRKARI